jgi:hypothetical protein
MGHTKHQSFPNQNTFLYRRKTITKFVTYAVNMKCFFYFLLSVSTRFFVFFSRAFHFGRFSQHSPSGTPCLRGSGATHTPSLISPRIVVASHWRAAFVCGMWARGTWVRNLASK